MAATAKTISKWFDNGVNNKYEYMIIVCDTFNYEDYPVYCSNEEFSEKHKEIKSGNMQKIMEVYDLSLDKESQIRSPNSHNYPSNWKKPKQLQKNEPKGRRPSLAVTQQVITVRFSNNEDLLIRLKRYAKQQKKSLNSLCIQALEQLVPKFIDSDIDN